MRVNYTKELLEENVKNCYSISELCRKIGLKPVGGNISTVRKKLDQFNVDYSHFTGQRWNTGFNNTNKTARYKLEDILQKNIKYSSDSLRKRLINEGIKESKCEQCGCTDVILELHHINGDHYDNRLENLQILCPNCHSKTENFRNRGFKKSENFVNLALKYNKNHYMICQYCGKEFYSDRTDRARKFCSRDCYNKYLKDPNKIIPELSLKTEITKEDILKHINNYDNLSSLAKQLNISRTTLRKKLIEFNLYEDFKFKYDFHSIKIQQYDLNMNLIKEWPSIIDAETSLNISSISKCLKGKQRSAGGFLWKYLEQ